MTLTKLASILVGLLLCHTTMASGTDRQSTSGQEDPRRSGVSRSRASFKRAIVRRGESSYNERSVELHFQHHENRIGEKLLIELVVHRDPIFLC